MMKRMKIWLVGLLTLIISVTCLSGCTLFKVGKYQATSLEVAGFSKEIDAANVPYIDLKLDGTAIVSIQVEGLSYEGAYNWKEKAEDSVILFKEKEGDGFELRFQDGKLVLNMLVVEIVFEK